MELIQGPDPDEGWPQTVVGYAPIQTEIADDPTLTDAAQQAVLDDFESSLIRLGYVRQGPLRCSVQRPHEAFASEQPPLIRVVASVVPKFP
jgi:hypothetical protein